LNPEYFASFMRLVLLVMGGFWTSMGLLIYRLRGMVEDGDTFIFWSILGGPYISSAEGRLEHAIFVSKITLLFGIPTLSVAVFLPDPILQVWSSLAIPFIILASLFLRLMFVADANDREVRHSRKGMDEGEAEKIRELEEEGKLRD
jgi:hypothetical protein